MPRLVLASASPRRKEMLEKLGFALEVIPAGVDESLKPGEPARRHVRRLALAKARAVARRLPREEPAFVIGADTAVVVDREVLGKPADPDDARRMLRLLSGRRHDVLTGYAIVRKSLSPVTSRAGVIVTRVEFKPLDETEIEAYIATGEPMDKAGAYAIQGAGGFMVKRIHGSHSNVIGLPLCEVVEGLRAMGAITGPIGPGATRGELCP